MEIRDRVAIVTGAARGIGRATAVALAEAGAAGVALADLRTDELEETASLVTAAGAEALPRRTDVSELAAWQGLVAEVEARFDRLHIVFNNAGLGEGPGDWPGLSSERAATIVDINLKGVVLGTHVPLPLMQRSGGGCIVQTASGAAFAPLPPQAVYAATKAGVVHFTKSCTTLVESHGVRVVCVAPGLVDTDMPLETGADGVAEWLAPMWEHAKLLQPEDIARATLELIRKDDNAGEILSVPNPT